MNLLETLESMKEPSLLLYLHPSESLGPNLDSRVGGYPYQLATEAPPVCHCHKPMTFLMQLSEPLQDGVSLAVIYYCFYCRKKAGTTEGLCVKTYRNPDPEAMKPASSFDTPPPPPADILLEPVWSLPEFEYLALSHPLLFAELSQIHQELAPERYEEAKAEAIGFLTDAEPYSLLEGYPMFAGNASRPICPCCSQMGEFWLQLDSYQESNLLFDGYGTLYLFRCSRSGLISFLVV